MPRVYLNEKEASALVVILDSYLRRYPMSCTAEMIKNVPERIARCLELQCKQGKKKAVTPKSDD